CPRVIRGVALLFSETNNRGAATVVLVRILADVRAETRSVLLRCFVALPHARVKPTAGIRDDASVNTRDFARVVALANELDMRRWRRVLLLALLARAVLRLRVLALLDRRRLERPHAGL